MDERLTICPVTLHHASTLAALHAESFGNDYWSLEQIRGSLWLTTTCAWLAYDGEMPIGFIFMQVVPHEAEILTFCICPARRRENIGAALLRHAMDAIRSED